MEIRADMKKEIKDKNKTQMAVIRSECDFDLELQMLVLGTIESHKKAKAQGCSILEAMAAAKADRADKQKAEKEADKEENWDIAQGGPLRRGRHYFKKWGPELSIHCLQYCEEGLRNLSVKNPVLKHRLENT